MKPSKKDSPLESGRSFEPIEGDERNRLIRRLNEELEIGMRDIAEGRTVDPDAFFAELARVISRNRTP